MTAAAESAGWDIRWRGSWVAPDLPDAPPGGVSFGGDLPPAPFSRSLYRRSFELGEVPATVPLRLTADSRYVLWVNGVEVSRGPARSQPRRLRYDEVDIAPHLVPGTNVLAVLVTYYGEANSFWQPAASAGLMGRDALMVLEARIGDEWLVSDETWRTRRSDAWSTLPHGALDGVPVEVLDARRHDPSWTLPGYDDGGWSSAEVVRVSHVGGLAQSRPPTDPFGALLPRGIGALGGDRVEPVDLRTSRATPPADDVAHPADRVTSALSASARDLAPASIPVRVEEATLLVADFGHVVAGFVELELDAPAGTTVDLLFQERRFDPEFGPVASAPRSGARYVARGGGETFEGLETGGLRWVAALISGPGGPVTVRSLRIREHRYPTVGGAFLRTGDAELDALYRAGIRTVELNAFDAFTDCPTREQRAWVGDGVVHQMVQLATNEDWRLARNYITLGDSPRADHMLPMTVVGEIEHLGATTIPDWSLHWVHGVRELFLHDGDIDFLLGVLPTAEKVLRWYLPYVDERGTIRDAPEWNLVDWSSVFSTGRSSILTSLWARGLRDYAELCDAVGNAGAAAWARALWDRARDGLEDFWDERRGTYVDQIVDGEMNPAASQAAGASAIVAGLAPRERWDRIVDAITDPDAVVIRSWIGGSDGGYDMQKIQEQSHGVQRIDWDPEREVVRAEPFFSYVVHDAIAAAGRIDRLVEVLRDWSVFLEDGFDTFGECWGWGTPVHGWSSTPTRDLVRHVLGVTPAEPGFAAVRVAPHPVSGGVLEGAVPTPHGLVRVSVEGAEVTIDSPVPVLLVRGGRQVRLASGRSSMTDAEAR